MARYTYHGPVQSLALVTGRIKDNDGNDVPEYEALDLHPGRETPDLPQDNPIIGAMIARGLLRPVTAAKKPAKAEPAAPADPKGEKS